MVRPAELRKIALSLAEVEEKPHFDRAAFRTPARIFATLGAKGADCNVRLPLEVQDMLVHAFAGSKKKASAAKKVRNARPARRTSGKGARPR